MSSIWKPLSRTSSVEAGTVAVKGDCRDRDDRLHKSSMGNCIKKKQTKQKAGLSVCEQQPDKPFICSELGLLDVADCEPATRATST